MFYRILRQDSMNFTTGNSACSEEIHFERFNGVIAKFNMHLSIGATLLTNQQKTAVICICFSGIEPIDS